MKPHKAPNDSLTGVSFNHARVESLSFFERVASASRSIEKQKSVYFQWLFEKGRFARPGPTGALFEKE